MEFKVSSGKSQGVAKLRRLFPRGWSGSSSFDRPNAALFDSLQGLIGFSDGTGRECAMRAARLPKLYIAEYCPLVVMCFDVHEDVPIAKAAEQSLRAEATRRAQEAKDALASESGRGYRELPEPGIWLDRLVPRDFAEGLQDRAGYRRAVVRFLCRQWIGSPDESVRLHPSPGCKVVISGHCLRPSDLAELTETEADWHALGLRAGDDPEHVPLVIESDTFRFDPDLTHRIGEGEMQFFHFIERLRPARSILVSTDSDVLFLAMAYLRDRPELTIDWRYDARTPDQRFCHVNAFVAGVRAGAIELAALDRKKRKVTDFANVDRRWIAQADPVAQIVAAQALAGTDYTQGMLMVTHEAVFEALVLACDKIGPLVPNPRTREVNPEAYVRLLVASWIQARLPELEIAPPAAGEEDPIKARREWQKHQLKAWKASQRFEPKYRFPHPVEDASHFVNRSLRWTYYMDMQLQVGRPELDLDDPGRWGYGPVGEPITRENIYPRLGDD